MSASPTSPSHPPQSSLQSALQMNSPVENGAEPELQQSARKRKKSSADEGTEPRRLRRSHEACSRCRSKKIKIRHLLFPGGRGWTGARWEGGGCSARMAHPRCTACASAGVVCAQEDRHRNTLTPRGHLERIELQLAQCQLLLKRHIPGFELNDLDATLTREGIEAQPGSYGPYPTQYPTPYPPVVYQHGYPIPPAPPGAFNPHIHPAFQQPYPTHGPPPAAPVRSLPTDIKGQDPNSNDMSDPRALAKNFGVSADIVSVIGANQVDKEDLAVGSSGLTSGRDRSLTEASIPRDPAHWVTVTYIWLPKDRKMVTAIVDVYFSRLNIHRPVFARRDFDKALDDLYEGQMATAPDSLVHHDPGFLCSFYLVLALGTLSDLNYRSVHHQIDDSSTQQLLVKKLMPPDWPEHDEFFERALSVKPDLRVTISSLQALILLHWYLYTERQGRTLWRLVGSLVRLSIELGLHHDPTSHALFTEEECILRINLWGIILIHDRGTSILLGRPLGIAPSDSSTPRPSRSKGHCDFSEHFELSHAVAEIQADIINSLYSPTRQKGDTLMRNATRVIKSMSEFRRTSNELHYEHRHKALIDAIVTAHNVIIFHSQLIRFPDIAFFTSPIPLHIAAMVILYGQMSNCERLPRQTAIEDVWLALDMLPRFRWRWERKDLNGGHPLIFQLASHVMGVDLHAVKPVTNPVLLSEPEWDDDLGIPSPMAVSQHTSAQHVAASNGAGGKHLVDIPTGLFYPFFPDENGNPPVSSPTTNGVQDPGYGHILAAAATHGQHGSYSGQGSQDTFISEERSPTMMHRAQWVGNNNMVGAFDSSHCGSDFKQHQRPYPVPPSA
ncbi:fungal-specific transcription factor domain-containing protein [Mycena olivaceomarginata]|nr:fungal-specific transcription factor domain-containing protein [Mycena olivaceomarginata]